MWYFHKGDLETIRGNLLKGRVKSKLHKHGMTESEIAKKFGVGRSFLEAHKVETWHEVASSIAMLPTGKR